ncbi:hypothetical protein HPP92_012660 [Vanilla planifolia]|uniref:DEP domain-containing protein n=1 Tax=Vanilla planifolia TaxID=51239 RepID=A0A835UZW1_VANPL|nr:hypothetical protein HPP92_012660 [Vanilla planifolia]
MDPVRFTRRSRRVESIKVKRHGEVGPGDEGVLCCILSARCSCSRFSPVSDSRPLSQYSSAAYLRSLIPPAVFCQSRLLMPKFEKSSWEQDPSGTRKTDAEQSTEESKKVNKSVWFVKIADIMESCRPKEDGESTAVVEGKIVSTFSEHCHNDTVDSQADDMGNLSINDKLHNNYEGDRSKHHVSKPYGPDDEQITIVNQKPEEAVAEEQQEDPVFDGTGLDLEATMGSFSQSPEHETDVQVSAWPEKAVVFKNFMKDRGSIAISSVLHRLSGKKDDDYEVNNDAKLKNEEEFNVNEEEFSVNKEEEDSSFEFKLREALGKAGDVSAWNPLKYIMIGRNVPVRNKLEQPEVVTDKSVEEQTKKGRIIVYTRLECQACRKVRSFMCYKHLTYVEINIDIYPSRKVELKRSTGSFDVPRVYFNDVLIGGLDELMLLDKSGMLDEKINILLKEEPPSEAPSPPLPGEDDVTGSGRLDELAAIVRKMRGSIVVKDRFYKMRRFSNCFLASEAVNFLAEDQYLEREEAIEFGRKLANQHFFRHVLDENIFDDGNHLYRFLEDEPLVMTQCYNFPSGTIDVQPKPITEIASSLRLLSYAIIEAYVSEDGRHIDYKSIHASEEFKRYLRIIEGLQRVDLDDLSREEKLAFFINLHNMMVIHAIFTYGYPVGPLDRRKLLGDFKYVVGGCFYSLSTIHNGVLRGNQRPPYNLIKPFGLKDKRIKVALSYPEPLVHFALVSGTKSGPPLRCYSPTDIDKELVDAARSFLRNGGFVLDPQSKVISASKILLWYSVDFGKNEMEVLKHAANYLEPTKSEELLELLASTQLKVTYQSYDWSLNS